MPIITVKIGPERTVEQKRALVRALTKAAVDILDAEEEWVTVLIEELGLGNWAVGGELLSDRYGPRRGTEGADQ
jgi:4-oxalocrotonate tautomerase